MRPTRLDPRPETEQLVEIALEIAKGHAGARILDIGTGSGVIALTVALELPHTEVHATDLSPVALALATDNAARHKLADRVYLTRADLLPAGDTTFDLIVANLPTSRQPKSPPSRPKWGTIPPPHSMVAPTASTSSGASSISPPPASHPEAPCCWKSAPDRQVPLIPY